MSDWMKQLNKMEGAVDLEYNPFALGNVVKSPSPYLNWVFGKGSGLPFGYSAIFYGPPKSGKSLAAYLMAAGLHAQDKEGIVIKFNTEMREGAQLGENWGLDPKRYQAYDVNDARMIFDRIKYDFEPLLQQGMPVKVIIIDSLKGIVGIKEGDRESIGDHLIGDHAITVQDGLKSILPIIRKYKIALICTEHIRANQDAGKYGKKEKMAGGWAEKHFFEYFLEVKRDGSAESYKSATGEAFEKETVDARGNKERTGHKIYVRMDDSSVGVSNRSGIITFSYEKGLINTEDEIFELVKNMNLVERPNNRTYIVKDLKFSSKEDFVVAIRDNKDLRQSLLESIYSKDKA